MLSESDCRNTNSTTTTSAVTAATDPNSPSPDLNPKPPSSSDDDFFSSASFASSSSSDDNNQTQIPPSSPTPPQIPISYPSDGILTRDWVMDLIIAFDWASRNLPPSELPSVLPVQVFDTLVLSASKILHKEPNCVSIEGFGPNSSVVVVGDVHGQLHDVIFLLREAGFPADDRFFVFNGDYVDRGAWGLETFLLLLAWKVYKIHIYVNFN
ncbi:hypothetical protein CsSME_00006101 [Camellia sinensis var. sinensis]